MRHASYKNFSSEQVSGRQSSEKKGNSIIARTIRTAFFFRTIPRTIQPEIPTPIQLRLIQLLLLFYDVFFSSINKRRMRTLKKDQNTAREREGKGETKTIKRFSSVQKTIIIVFNTIILKEILHVNQFFQIELKRDVKRVLSSGTEASSTTFKKFCMNNLTSVWERSVASPINSWVYQLRTKRIFLRD